jgi:hypothetical protein
MVAHLTGDPTRTAKSLFLELRQRDPTRHPMGQLRTFQRRVATWRAQAILEFSDEWLAADVPLGKTLPGALHLHLDPSAPETVAG